MNVLWRWKNEARETFACLKVLRRRRGKWQMLPLLLRGSEKILHHKITPIMEWWTDDWSGAIHWHSGTQDTEFRHLVEVSGRESWMKIYSCFGGNIYTSNWSDSTMLWWILKTGPINIGFASRNDFLPSWKNPFRIASAWTTVQYCCAKWRTIYHDHARNKKHTIQVMNFKKIKM